MTATYATLVSYRGRSNDTVALNDNTTWANVQSGSWVQAVDTVFRVRFEVEEQNNKLFTWQGTIEYSYNGGAYTQVTTTSSVVKAVASSQFADLDPTTNLLTASAKTFVAGYGSETGDTTNTNLTNTHSENEYALQIVGTDVTNGLTLLIRPIGLTGYTVSAASIKILKAISLTVQASTQSLTSDNITLTNHPPLATLTIQDSTQAQSAESPLLVHHVAVVQLVVSNSEQSTTSENTILVYHATVITQDSSHVISSESTILTQHQLLVISDSIHAQESENITLTILIAILISDSNHVLTSDNIVFSSGQIFQTWMLLMTSH